MPGFLDRSGAGRSSARVELCVGTMAVPARWSCSGCRPEHTGRAPTEPVSRANLVPAGLRRVMRRLLLMQLPIATEQEHRFVSPEGHKVAHRRCVATGLLRGPPALVAKAEDQRPQVLRQLRARTATRTGPAAEHGPAGSRSPASSIRRCRSSRAGRAGESTTPCPGTGRRPPLPASPTSHLRGASTPASIRITSSGSARCGPLRLRRVTLPDTERVRRNGQVGFGQLQRAACRPA